MNATNDQKDVQGKPTSRQQGCLGCLGRGALGLLVLLVAGMAAGVIYQAAAGSNDIRKYPPPGELYDLGEYRLHLYCTGEGSPTVILEAGAGNPALTWYLVQGDVSESTRVCSYDRPGYGWSDPASGPLSREQVATTLHQLLETAGVPGPYILVGHSAGGEYIRAYARQYPSDVAGLVFVDSSHENQNLRFPPQFLEYSRNQLATMRICQLLSPFGVLRLTRLWNSVIPESLSSSEMGDGVMSTMYRSAYCRAAYWEDLTFLEPSGQTDGPAGLGDLSLIVLSAGDPFGGIPEAMVAAMGGPEVVSQVNRVHEELQQELASLSTQGKLIIAVNSGHEIHWDQPELVVDAILTLVGEGRDK